MKLKLLSLIAFIITVTTACAQSACNTGQCLYTFYMTDSAGDGWNGGSMIVVQNNITIATLSMDSGSSASVTIGICDSVPFFIYWDAQGSAQGEIGLSVENAYTQTIFTMSNGSGVQGSIVYEDMGQCGLDMCYGPYNVQATTSGVSATVSFAGINTGLWQYYLATDQNDVPGPEQVEGVVPFTTQPFTINCLDPETTYYIYVREKCISFEIYYTEWVAATPVTTTGFSLTGRVMADLNGDQVCNGEDIGVSNMEIQVSVNGEALYSAYTDITGNYTITGLPCGENTYSLQPVSPPGILQSAPVIQSLNFDGGISTEIINICLEPDQGTPADIGVFMLALNDAVEEEVSQYVLYVQNNSPAFIENATVSIDYLNDYMELNAAENPYTSPSDHIIHIETGSIEPFELVPVNLSFNIFGPLGTIPNSSFGFHQYAFTDVIENENTLADNYHDLIQDLTNEPLTNSIAVAEGSMLHIENPNPTLHYTIRFHNDSSGPYQDIRIENDLDANFNPATFNPVGSSHPYTVTRTGSHLTFRLNDISLPDAGSDAENSYGYIAYSIEPINEIQEGDIVNNQAQIYFDEYPIVQTNVETSEYYSILLTDNPLRENGLKVYPVPVKNVLNIDAGNQQVISVTIYDLNGRICLKGTEAQLDVSRLIAGIYLAEITTDAGSKTIKLVKE